MLCPEVAYFQAPKSNHKIEILDLDTQKCLDHTNNLCYNHLVSVVLPDTLQVPTYLSDSLVEDCDYYKVLDFDVREVVTKNFVFNFLKQGCVNALSIQNCVDLDDCVCLLPNGKLIFLLNKETYQCFGWEGTVSHFHKKNKGKYIVSINLNALEFGGKSYARLAKALGTLPKFTVLFSWQPRNEDVCPSSVAKYFTDLKYDVKLCKPRFESRTSYSVKVPTINFEQFDTTYGGFELIEWLGMCSIEANFDFDEYFSSYKTPEPNIEYGQVKLLQWRGFYSKKQVECFLNELKKFAAERNDCWVAAYMQGFSDAIVIDKENENYFYTNADNSRVVVMNDKKCILFVQNISNKIYF